MMTHTEGRIWGALILTGALTGAAVAQTTAPDMVPAAGILPSGFGDAVDRDVSKVRSATVRLKSTDAAVAAGYKQVTECVEHQPEGAMGYHFQNNALLDTTLDVEHPEVLVYERSTDGTFKLNGVEFLVPISSWTASEPPRVMGQALKRADPWACGTSTCGRGSPARPVSSRTGIPG